jgi:hypothetical protein
VKRKGGTVETETQLQLDSPPVASNDLSAFLALSESEKALVTTFVDCGYSVAETAGELGVDAVIVRQALNRPAVKQAVLEVQEQIGDIDYVNEKWFRAQVTKMIPKLLGEEEVPIVTAQGERVTAYKFFPDIALKAMEMLVPRKTTPGVVVNINNINRLSDADLEKIAAKDRNRTLDV